MNYKARGIVLHTMKYGETSTIAFLLTDALGRQNYLVQGARTNGKTNKTALLQPMFVVDVEAVHTPRTQLHRVREVANAMPHASIPFDVRKSTIALFMAEVLYRLVKESEANPPLFNFVVGAIGALDALPDAAGTANFHLWFLVRLSFHLGFFPGNEPIDGGWFDIENGIFVAQEPTHKLAFGPESAAILGSMMTAEATELASTRLARGQRSAFLSDMLVYFGYHLDGIRAVRSIEILRDVF